jgi:hypothetical protein
MRYCEAWLYKNNEAEASLRRGLAQASGGLFSTSPPDLKADQSIVDLLEEEGQAQPDSDNVNSTKR